MACLDENTVTAFIEGSLSPEALAEVEEHVDRCVDCRQLLSAVAPFLDAPSRAETSASTGSLSITTPLGIDRIRWTATMRVGKTIREKWYLERLLGVGGTAAVYEATHRNHGGRAAIKILHHVLPLDSRERQRFLREGYAANAVAHPGVVRVLDDDVDESGALYLVSELASGETLHARLRRLGPLPASEVLRFADDVLDVLAAAHEKGIVHRDIKPENILMCTDGGTRVLDFGIAQIREATYEATQTTATGIALGTPAFMPPEQALGETDRVGPASDIWALGATMYTLLTGRLVHHAGTVTELMLAAMKKPAPLLRSVAPQLAEPIHAVVDRALAFEINDRFATARSMQEAVRRARTLETPDDPTTVLTVPRQTARKRPELHAPSPRSNRRLLGIFAVGLVSALAFGGLWASNRGQTRAEEPSSVIPPAVETTEPSSPPVATSATSPPQGPITMTPLGSSASGKAARSTVPSRPRPAEPRPSPHPAPPAASSNWLDQRTR